MDALDVGAWHEFFTVSGTATAAWLGLILLAISLHAREVESNPLLRNRARATLGQTTTGLVISLLALFPRIGPFWFGWGVVGVGAVYIGWVAWSLGVAWRAAGGLPPHIWLRVAGNANVLIAIAGGVSLAAGRGPGVFLVAAAIVFLLPAMLFSTWDLLFAPELRGRGARPSG